MQYDREIVDGDHLVDVQKKLDLGANLDFFAKKQQKLVCLRVGHISGLPMQYDREIVDGYHLVDVQKIT